MDSQFFLNNRKNLIASLGGGLVVLSAYTKMQALGDTAHPFLQEPNFWYLTGIEYPDWLLIIDSERGKSLLVAPEVDSVHELFDGSLGRETAKTISGVDDVIDKNKAEELLESLAKKHRTVYTIGEPKYKKYADFTLNPAPGMLQKKLKKLFAEVKGCQNELAKLRAIKQPEEIMAVKNATNISDEAFKKAKENLTAGKYEYEVEAELAYDFRRRDAHHAFDPIVAAGKNACTLHYVSNASMIRPNELLLIDAGAKRYNYSADITRTFAAGSLTKRQQAVHTAVKLANEQITELIKPELPIKEYIKSSDAIMKDTLLSLGLMKDKKDSASYRRYFPHAISHGLGLEVHESLGGFDSFVAGHVLTVEPGVYIPEEGIGVRIEDNILVTKTDNENLSAGISTDL